jgi:DNA-directed RNA polymerase specialized sigma subunit
MDWKREAEQELKQYPGRCRALKNIKLRHQALKEEMVTLKGASTDRIPVRGGASRMEDALVNNIVERQRLELTYKLTHKLVDLTKQGLDSLSQQERDILTRFYIEEGKYTADNLCEELHLERSRIYRLKDQALYNFTINMYGIEKL